MKHRGAVAVTVLLAWAGGLVTFMNRERRNAPAQRLAEAALRVSPGAAYYRVEKDGRQIGFASSTIDTTRGSLSIRDYLSAELPVGGTEHRATATSDVRLSRTLALTDFQLSFEADGAPIAMSGRSLGDSALQVVIAHDEMGSIITALEMGKPIVVMPRRAELGEHRNDHQVAAAAPGRAQGGEGFEEGVEV